MAELALKRPRVTRAPEPKRRRGLLDFVCVALAVYAMIGTTPAGGLVLRAWAWARSEPPPTRALTSYFTASGAETPEAKLVATAITAPPRPDAPTSQIAQRIGLDPELARAVAVLSAGGREVEGGHLDVVIAPAAAASFAEVGAEVPRATDPAALREQRLLEGLMRLTTALGSEEAAVAAVAVELPHVRYAVERARAVGARDPVSYEALRAFLAPDHRRRADALVDGTFALSIALHMTWPVAEDVRVSSPFGSRAHPVTGATSFHTGTDLAVPIGTDVHAAARGKVLYATMDSMNGRFVKLDHGHGLMTAYCHASELDVGRGDAVGQGDRVARSGNTGRSTGPHLHFQVELNGKPVNPELFRPRR